MNISLKEFPDQTRQFLSVILIVLSFGVFTGILFIRETTEISPKGAVERFNGSETEDEFGIQENYAKPYSEMLLTTHTHILGFSFLIFIVGTVFSFNSIVVGKWKKALLIEAPVSVLTTFGSIWLVRYWHPDFVYLTVISSILMYVSIFTMIGISLFELNKKSQE